MERQDRYMQRCYDLAMLAGKEIGTNPHVGAVLVHNDRIIGEGYYAEYGGAHAEVRALESVRSEDRHLIKDSILFVSLEPCCIHGKTPPCTDAILREGIKEAHIGTIDPFEGIAGNGIDILKKQGVNVLVYEDERAKQIIAPFSTYHVKKRPYITFKFAKSKDNYIGRTDQQVWLTNAKTSVFTHKMRAEMDAILVGTNTVVTDDPSLTTRHYPGPSPQRLVIDLNGRIPLTTKVLSDEHPTVIFSTTKRELPDNKNLVHVTYDDVIDRIQAYCYDNKIVNLMVEGGAKTIRSFFKAGLWDEAYIISTNHVLGEGIKAPQIDGRLISKDGIDGDEVLRILS